MGIIFMVIIPIIIAYKACNSSTAMDLLNKSFILGEAAHGLGSAALCAPRVSTSRRYTETLAFIATSLSLYYGPNFSTMYDVNYFWAFYMSNFIFHLNSLL